MQKRGYLILIVEDDFIIARDLHNLLKAQGYCCLSNVGSYDDAVKVIETEKPSLVLIDIMLGKTQDGLRIGNYLYKKGTIPYIYMTSLYDKNTILEIKQTFPYGYIVKPYKQIDVITNVELVLNNFRHHKIDIQRATKPEIADDVPFIIKKVITYINDNIKEKIQLEDLIALTRWKKHNFIRIFTQYIGETPYHYVLKCKIQKCMALIETTDLNTSDIAFELGFNSYSSFHKIFTKMTGTTVDEFRKKSRLSKLNSNSNTL